MFWFKGVISVTLDKTSLYITQNLQKFIFWVAELKNHCICTFSVTTSLGLSKPHKYKILALINFSSDCFHSLSVKHSLSHPLSPELSSGDIISMFYQYCNTSKDSNALRHQQFGEWLHFSQYLQIWNSFHYVQLIVSCICREHKVIFFLIPNRRRIHPVGVFCAFLGYLKKKKLRHLTCTHNSFCEVSTLKKNMLQWNYKLLWLQ